RHSRCPRTQPRQDLRSQRRGRSLGSETDDTLRSDAKTPDSATTIGMTPFGRSDYISSARVGLHSLSRSQFPDTRANEEAGSVCRMLFRRLGTRLAKGHSGTANYLDQERTAHNALRRLRTVSRLQVHRL